MGKANFDRWQHKRKIYDMINKWTYDHFCEARQQMQPVTTRMLQQWASQAAIQYEESGFSFVASLGWVNKFKLTHSICKRKVMSYIKS